MIGNLSEMDPPVAEGVMTSMIFKLELWMSTWFLHDGLEFLVSKTPEGGIQNF